MNISKKVQSLSFNLKIRGYADSNLYLLSGAAFTFMFIGLMTSQAHAQTETLSPLTQDQDGDGDPLNEESDIAADCNFDHKFSAELSESVESTFGIQWETPPTLSEEDCNFAMHYLSGQCEEQVAKGVNVTGVCDATLRDYLSTQNLYTKDFPTDTERYNTILDEFKQKRTSEKQEAAQTEADKPSWAENLQ